MNDHPNCRHPRKRLIAKDDDETYIECLDCGALLEARELAEPTTQEPSGFDESLSDA